MAEAKAPKRGVKIVDQVIFTPGVLLPCIECHQGSAQTPLFLEFLHTDAPVILQESPYWHLPHNLDLSIFASSLRLQGPSRRFLGLFRYDHKCAEKDKMLISGKIVAYYD